MLILVEAVLLTAALYPIARLYTVKGFRSRLTALSGINLLIIACTLGYLSFVLALALFFPLGLHPLILLVALVYLILYRRARPSYGTGQGLAPGSLAFFPIGQWNDPSYYKKRFETYGPIFKSSDLHRPAVNILGIERARSFLSQYGDAVHVPAFPFDRFIPNRFLRFADPAHHAVARPLFQTIFNSAVIRDAEPELAQAMRRDIAAMTADSHNSPDGILPQSYFYTILDHALTRLFFGITPESAIYPEWQNMFYIVAFRRASHVPDAQVRQTLTELMRVLQAQTETDDLPRSFVSELKRLKPGALSDPFYIYNLIYTHQVGRGDMIGLFSWILKMLSDNPEWVAHLRAPDAPADLPARIVLETLRLRQSEFLLRQTTRDIHFENVSIPKGWYVRMCIKESHHASDAFENTTDFNPDRFLRHRYTRSEYMPFGTFNKSCLGEQITISLAKLFVTELARNHTWRIIADAPQEFNGFHWQPSSKLRITLDN